MPQPGRRSTHSLSPAHDAGVSDPGETPKGSAAVGFEKCFPARPESVAEVRAALVAFVRERGVAQPTIDAMTLAVSEAATNVVMHAYPAAGERGEIVVSAALAGGELWVIVTDAGSGLQPRRDSPGLGLGLAIIARVADGVDLITPATGGLEVRMRFAVSGSAA
jgi:serine/threonine-protein kinase RsbW